MFLFTFLGKMKPVSLKKCKERYKNEILFMLKP